MKLLYRKYFSCERFAWAMSKRKDQELSSKNKLLYWLHYFMCFTCRRVNKQIDIIDDTLQHFSCCNKDQNMICKSSKDRIKQLLQSEIASSPSSEKK